MLKSLLLAIAAILAIIWVVALLAKVTAGAIHLLLVVAVILVVANFVLGRNAV